MANPIDIPQNFSSTLNVGGGINNSQTAGIISTSVTGLPTDGGMLALDWADPIDTATIEYFEYTGITGNEFTGVTRGQEGVTAKSHSNGATIVGVVSRAHIKRLRDKLTGNDTTAIQDPNGNEILKTSYVASAVNEITTANAATGNSPSVAATGGDTNIGLIVKGKGTGPVRLGQSTSTDVRLEADQPIADSSGNEYIKFSKTASAVNEITVTNAATGNPPITEATGGDTNIHLVVRAKGNGLLKTSVLRQDDTTNSYKHNSVILTGWGYKQAAAAQTDSEAVSFDITFAQVPILICSSAGGKSTAPSGLADMSTNYYGNQIFPMSISTTGFTAQCGSLSYDGANPPNLSGYWAYTWIAIGEL